VTAVHIPANYCLTDILAQDLTNAHPPSAVQMDIAQTNLLALLAAFQETVTRVIAILDLTLANYYPMDILAVWRVTARMAIVSFMSLRKLIFVQTVALVVLVRAEEIVSLAIAAVLPMYVLMEQQV
jgi:hypothetical protein